MEACPRTLVWSWRKHCGTLTQAFDRFVGVLDALAEHYQPVSMSSVRAARNLNRCLSRCMSGAEPLLVIGVLETDSLPRMNASQSLLNDMPHGIACEGVFEMLAETGWQILDLLP